MEHLRYPNESAAYRAARNALLEDEIALRAQIEAVAARRRALPLGGKVPEDYVFERIGRTSMPEKVRMSELFGPHDTLILYSFMYGPKMKAACPMCTSFLDALDGNAQHLAQRTNLVVIAKSPLERITEHAHSRGWRNLRLLSSAGNSYNRDYHGESEDGGQIPIMNVFVKNAKVRHRYATEMVFGKADKGQNQRHIDMMWPLWNLLDLTPEGRGADWYPKLAY